MILYAFFLWLLFPIALVAHLSGVDLELKGGVQIDLKNGVTLFCHNANLDWQAKEGHLDAQPHCLAIFSLANGQMPMTLATASLRLKLDSSSHLFAEQVIADEKLILSSDSFTIVASAGLYLPQQQKLLLYQRDESANPCFIFRADGDIVSCQAIELLLSSLTLEITQPYGMVAAGSHWITAAAHKAYGSLRSNALQLQGQAKIWYGPIGLLKSDTIDISAASNKQSKLVAYGIARVTYGTHPMSHITAPGGVSIDTALQQIVATGNKDSAGQHQVVLHSLQRHLAADSILLLLQTDSNKGIVPYKLQVDGQVNIVSEADEGSEKGLQAASADHLEYDFVRQELLLRADAGKYVVIFDGENSVVATATAFRLRGNPQNAAGHISGQGDVNFRFVKDASDLPQLPAWQALMAPK